VSQQTSDRGGLARLRAAQHEQLGAHLRDRQVRVRLGVAPELLDAAVEP
jgi:hypothetical protein